MTHSQNELNVPRLAAGAFGQLDLTDILTAPEYFLVPLIGAPGSLGEVEQVTEPAGHDPVLPLGSRANFSDSGYAFYPAPRPALRAGQSSRWFFGRTLSASHASLLLGAGATPAQIRFGLVSSSGRTIWGRPVAVVGGARSVGSALPHRPGVGLAVEVVSGHLPSHQSDVRVGQRTYELDGALSRAVQPGHWRQQGSINEYTLYVRKEEPVPVYAVERGRDPAPHVKVLAQADNSETIRVRAHSPVAVVRDVAWDGGWSATNSTNGGPAVSVPVEKHGLVQEVKLPTGSDVVRFAYQPRHWLVATVLSEGATLFLLLLLVDIGLRRSDRWPWHRRSHKGEAGAFFSSRGGQA